jgi:uncharacterized protein (TIGR02246 family)
MIIESPAQKEAANFFDHGAAIASVIRRWADAWNAHNAIDMALLVAPDVDFVNVAGRWLQGVEEFREWHRKIHALHFRDSSWENIGHRVRFLTAQLALVQPT